MSAPRRLNSPGPVAAAFLRSRAFICGIIGPVGSGKTLTALQKCLQVGAIQGGKRDEKDVLWRKARVGVLRESYPNLEANTLKSWWNIVPEEEGKFSWKAPYVHSFRKILRREGNVRDGRPIDVLDMQVEFRAIGDRSVEEVTRGWEVNAVFVDEFDLQPPDLISFLSGRVGRFSSLDPNLVVDPQIIVSLNAPYTDNHAYKLLIEKELGNLDDPELVTALEGRPLVECFIQPGGREPDAENIHNLRGGRSYYVLQAAANKHRPGYVERMIDNKFVPMQHGQPVNPDFSFSEHVRPLEYDPRRPLILGVDQGLFAASVASQRTIMGQLRTLRETVLIREDGKALMKIGPTAFGRMCRQMLSDHFPELRPENLRVRLDPAAFAASDREDDEHDWVLAFQAALGAKVRPAKTNKQALRLEAIHRAMGERDGYAIDPSCKHLIRAHLGGYHFKKAEISDGETRGHLTIADTIYTHVADAEQYAALEGEHVVSDIRGHPRRGAAARVTVNSDYRPFG